MRPIQNAGGEETIRERSYPVAKATAITAGQVVQLSGGKVVPAAAAQTAAILGIAGEDHSGTGHSKISPGLSQTRISSPFARGLSMSAVPG